MSEVDEDHQKQAVKEAEADTKDSAPKADVKSEDKPLPRHSPDKTAARRREDDRPTKSSREKDRRYEHKEVRNSEPTRRKDTYSDKGEQSRRKDTHSDKGDSVRKKEAYSDKKYEKGVSRSRSEPAQVGKSGRFGRSGDSSDSHTRSEDKSRSKPRDKGHDRKDGSGEGGSSGNGEEILSMLQKSTPKKTELRFKSKKKDKDGASGPSATELEAKWQKEEAEKRKKQEEEQRAEEESRRLEEEKKRKEEEEERIKQEEIRSIEDFIKELKAKISLKKELREYNVNAAENRPDESFFGRLDSSLKKNTAFVKKLRNLTESQKDGLTKDFSSLNLTKYVGEAANAITDAKLKMSDIACGLHLCSLLNQRYAEFSPTLLECWQKVLLSKKVDKVTNLSKLRVDLRFFAELISISVFSQKEGLPILANQLMILINNDKEEHNNLSIISSFCKHCGDDYAGLVPRKYRLLAEKYNFDIPKSQVLPAERQKACHKLFSEYYQSLCIHVLKDIKELRSLERQNRKILQTKGELSQERQDKYESCQQTFQKLLQNMQTFADVMDENLPEFPEEEVKTDSENVDIFSAQSGTEYQYEGDLTLFEDEDTRMFYEHLKDLRAFIPGILYKDSEKTTEGQQEEQDENDEDLKVEDVEKEMEVEQQKQETEEQTVEKKETPEKESKEKEIEEEHEIENLDAEDDELDMASSMKLILDAFLQNLPNSVNRELIDKAAIDFCTNLNTKNNRKKLVKAIFTVHRTRYDLLPFYSRFIATLNPCMPDLATDLVTLLKGDFKWHVRKKDQINIESKLKTVRFIGEMVKFNMFPKTEALHCLKMLLFDFSHHNIEMACALLETCGRFLYRSADSHHRTRVYLEVMMRKKTALHLDSRYTTMIENAFYYSNPPEVKQEAKKERPPMKEYIRRLVYKDLSKVTTEKILRQMRKLDWDDPEIFLYITKCLTGIWNVRYNCVHCAANLLAGLAPYHESIAIDVVDNILEDIRVGMEVNHPKFNQRRVSCVKYLGELYNYRMVESAVVFKTLYSFISFGITLDENVPTPMDPPEHLFRIRLVSVLLDTCGQYFDRGSSKRKLDCFLVYFQRYYWFKRSLANWDNDHPFPMDVEYLVKDMFEAIRPKTKIHSNKDDANDAADQLDKEFRLKLAEVLPMEAEDTEEDLDDESGLPPIQETDELDEMAEGLSQTHITGEESSQDSEMERDYRSGSQSLSRSQTQEGDKQTTEESEGQDEDDDLIMSPGEEEADDQVTLLVDKPKHIQCPEDDDFMTAFDKMMADNLSTRTHDTVKVPQMDIGVPLHIKGQQKKGMIDESTNSINFVVMTKRGNKQQFSNLSVPLSEQFASKYKEREVAQRAEKERMKKVVLDMHERQEEEEHAEMIAGMNRAVGLPNNMNRERRVKYQHPKGAPDADLIFGSKFVKR